MEQLCGELASWDHEHDHQKQQTEAAEGALLSHEEVYDTGEIQLAHESHELGEQQEWLHKGIEKRQRSLEKRHKQPAD